MEFSGINTENELPATALVPKSDADAAADDDGQQTDTAIPVWLWPQLPASGVCRFSAGARCSRCGAASLKRQTTAPRSPINAPSQNN